MEYVNFGDAGVKVSPIALGMGLRGQSSAKEAESLVNHAIDSGVNLIDCANIYGLGNDRKVRGTSEELLGRFLKNR
ncbi:MAG: aldo/keto reductase, partial [SAR202 cluster bacterium]|nr:aldo/keto reductase [SAR202 cluster bacterium]